jgi:negative regulator of flagellin synthesis FlgM
MPVNPIQNRTTVQQANRTRPESETEPAADAAHTAERIEVSERDRELARAQRAVGAAPDVRADKIAELKEQIEDGTYDVPAEALADKLLEMNGDQ